jgi:hypothetical protein
MCVLAIWLGIDSATPLLVGANRDEQLTRPSAAPSEIELGIFAGRDLESGGTWLGYTSDGLFVALTNRRTPARTPASESRGQLVMAALRSGSLQQAERTAEEAVSRGNIAGFNLVAVHRDRGVCLHFDGTLRPAAFGPGIHVVSSDVDLNDPAMPEKQTLQSLIRGAPGLPDENLLREFLGSHDGERPVCKHGARFGTVSSTILSFSRNGARMLYADGPPCRTPFAELEPLALRSSP